MALVLVLASSAFLMYFFRNGAPSRGALGLLIAIGILTPVLMRWQFGFWILFAYFPFSSGIRRLYLYVDTFNAIGADPMLLIPDAIMALMAVGFLLNVRSQRGPPEPPGYAVMRASVLLLMALCILEVFNPVMGSVLAGLNGLRQYTIWFMLFFMLSRLLDTKEKVFGWIRMSVIIGTVTGTYGAYQYLFGFPYHDKLWADLASVSSQAIGKNLRAFSTLGFTSTFAHYMIITASMAFVGTQIKGLGRFANLVLPFCLIVMLAGLGFTFVRSAYIGLAFAIIAGVVASSAAKARPVRVVAMVLLCGALYGAIPNNAGDAETDGAQLQRQSNMTAGALVADRALSIVNSSAQHSVGVRYGLWVRAVQYSFTFPMGLGLGAGAGAKITGDYVTSAWAYTESQLFGMLTEMGWLGFLLYSWVTLCGFWYTVLVHDRLEDPDLKKIAVMSLMIQVSLTVCGIGGGSVLYTLPGSVYYWAALGLPAALWRIQMADWAKRQPAVDTIPVP